MGELFAEQCQTIADAVITSAASYSREYRFRKELSEGSLMVVMFDFSHPDFPHPYKKKDLHISVYGADGKGWLYIAKTDTDGNWLPEPMDSSYLSGLPADCGPIERNATTKHAEKILRPVCDFLLSEEIDEEQLQ